MLRPLPACCAILLGGCAALPPGHDYPREPPLAAPQSPNAALLQPFAAAGRAHPGQSGFRMLPVGVDGLLLRLELIAQASSSLDLQYYIFHGDESGRLVTEALARAAARGVRVRILVDDAETIAGDEQLFSLVGHPNVAIRVFNPWRYRGHSSLLRGAEFLFNHERLDYRMHNKLFVADGAIALIGGRNIGDQYFQVDPDSQFADDDVFATGPVVSELAATFAQYWDNELAIPAQALSSARSERSVERALAVARRRTPPEKAANAGFNYQQRLEQGEPLAGILSGETALEWARAEVACDTPDKKHVVTGERVGRLSFTAVANAIRQTQSELTIVSAYLVPTPDEMTLLEERRALKRRVRVLTTSLEASNVPLAQAGYMHYRVPMLEAGVELYELRALPESRRGSGESKKLTRSGNYSLHAKLLVFDRSGVFVGSMNYDQRSRWLNTETGLIIRSAALAERTAARFAAMTQPQSAYAVTLEAAAPGRRSRLTWTTQTGGRVVSTHTEPARSLWQRLEVHLLSLLHFDREL